MSGFAQDNLFDAPQAVVDFQFDERTVAVFADMIHRSIPAYAGLLQMTAVVAGQFLRDGDHVYDLGCSLGGVSLALRQFVPAQLRISALDLSEAMVKRLRDYLSGVGIENIEVIQADLQDYRAAIYCTRSARCGVGKHLCCFTAGWRLIDCGKNASRRYAYAKLV